jgi:hypothetical protein
MDMDDAGKITQLGKSNLKILINSVYGTKPGSDNFWQDVYKQL